MPQSMRLVERGGHRKGRGTVVLDRLINSPGLQRGMDGHQQVREKEGSSAFPVSGLLKKIFGTHRTSNLSACPMVFGPSLPPPPDT